MTALPAASTITGSSVTEGEVKTRLTELRAYLADLFGADGTKATALTMLGALLNGSVAKAAGYTVVDADRGKLIDCSGTWTLALTPAATLGAGFVFAVRNSGAGTITINPDLSEQIDGASTLDLAGEESCMVVCDGTAFKTVGKGAAPMPAATASNDGYMTSAYAAKLDGIEAGANVGVDTDAGVAGIGLPMLLTVAGASTASGATIAGTGLQYMDGPTPGALVNVGTWRNVSGITIPSTSYGTFQRIS